jgi:Leucine-rich repeat (LRR) protein
LNELNVSGNSLTDVSLGQTALEALDLSQNRLRTMPAVQSALKNLVLDFNRISELKFRSRTLQSLRIQLNIVTDVSLECKLPHLMWLDITRNRLAMLPDLSGLTPALRVLHCGDNFLTEWPALPVGVQEVDIHGNRLKSLPELWRLSPELRTIDVSHNQLQEIPRLPLALTSLDMRSNRVRSMVPGTYPNLRWLVAEGNEFRELPELREIRVEEYFMASNRLQAIDPARLYRGVRRLELAENEIAAIPPELLSFESLTRLVLNHNRITGIPEEVRGSSLEVLHVTWNPLETLPAIWPLSLKSFFCGYCGIAAIPDHFVALPSFRGAGRARKPPRKIAPRAAGDDVAAVAERFPGVPGVRRIIEGIGLVVQRFDGRACVCLPGNGGPGPLSQPAGGNPSVSRWKPAPAESGSQLLHAEVY